MDEKLIDEKLLDRLDAEHELLVQPRAIDKEMRRLARMGLWAESNLETVRYALGFTDSELCRRALEELLHVS